MSFVHSVIVHTECETSENKQHTYGHMSRSCVNSMCKIKSVKNEMLNSSCKNDVNELSDAGIQTYECVHRTKVYFVKIYYIYIFIYVAPDFSVRVLNCFFVFVFFFSHYGRLYF